MKSNLPIIQNWVSLFNEGDSTAIAQLYHKAAINHLVANEAVI